MRVFMTAAATCGMLAATVSVEAQVVNRKSWSGDGGRIVRQQAATPNRPVVADRHDHGHHDHHHHGGYGGGHGYGGIRGGYGGYGGGYGYGGYAGYGYSGFNFGGPGYGFSYYNGPSNLGPLINPPIYAFGPYSSGYGFGYAPTFGYGSAWAPAGYPDPINNQLLQQQYNNDWTVLSARLADLAVRNEAEPAAGTTAVPIPSTPELMIKSLRFQAQGDEAFGNQDFQRAYDRYKQAMLTAKDNGAAQFRMGYTLVALGQHSRAIEHFKRGLLVEPALAITGPAPSELYGDNNLAWSSHLAKVTQWVREDIRDYNRVFLLGVLLFFDGDT
nr:tetratricopeptide repeat protein [Planctomycetota bacterium]